MVGDSPITVFSEAVNVRQALATLNASVTNAETAFSTAVATKFGYLLSLMMICTAAATTIGTWTVRSSLAGATIYTFPQPVAAAAIGTLYTFSFEMPWKTATINASFTIAGSAATMGTWFLLPNGFYSSL